MNSRRLQFVMLASSVTRSLADRDRSSVEQSAFFFDRKAQVKPPRRFSFAPRRFRRQWSRPGRPQNVRSLDHIESVDSVAGDSIVRLEHDRKEGGRVMGKAWRRRAFLGASIVGTFGARAAAQRDLLAAQVTRETFTYKTAGNLSIKADVSRGSPEKRRPVAVWIHGGALIMGDRRGIDRVAGRRSDQSGLCGRLDRLSSGSRNQAAGHPGGRARRVRMGSQGRPAALRRGA